jgi:DNA polymerase III epsilon subunit-like protein
MNDKKIIMNAELPLCFIDIETMGTYPETHEVIEIACIRTVPFNPRKHVLARTEVLDRWCYRMLPVTGNFQEEALNVNGFDRETWAETAMPRDFVVRRLAEAVEGTIVVAHNTSFDRPFYEILARQMGVELKPAVHRPLDTVSLLWPLVVAGLLESPSLEAACDYFGISNEGAHNALIDAERCRQVYYRAVTFQHNATQVARESIRGLLRSAGF